jgi:nucleoside-diphosphate-sugar epimerase
MNPIKQNVSNVIESQVWPDLTDKKVLITGGTGLVGIHMATFFNMMGAEVESIHSKNIPYYFEPYLPVVDMVQLDLARQRLNPECKFDIIVHCAGYAQPSKFIKDPLSTIAINTTCTANLFKNLAPDGKFLFLSSDAVYTGSGIPYLEIATGRSYLDHPRAAYMESKKVGELITKYNGGVIARLSYCYGPGGRLDDTRVVNELIIKALTVKKLVVENGLAMRSWLYISDALRMLLNILFFAEPEEVYNVANDPNKIIDINNLAYTIASLNCIQCDVHPTYKEFPDTVSLDMNKYNEKFGEF